MGGASCLVGSNPTLSAQRTDRAEPRNRCSWQESGRGQPRKTRTPFAGVLALEAQELQHACSTRIRAAAGRRDGLICPTPPGADRRRSRPSAPVTATYPRTCQRARAEDPSRFLTPRPVAARQGRSSESVATPCAVKADLDALELDADDTRIPESHGTNPSAYCSRFAGGSTPRISRCPRALRERPLTGRQR